MRTFSGRVVSCDPFILVYNLAGPTGKEAVLSGLLDGGQVQIQRPRPLFSHLVHFPTTDSLCAQAIFLVGQLTSSAKNLCTASGTGLDGVRIVVLRT
jgi:hypothetical protein